MGQTCHRQSWSSSELLSVSSSSHPPSQSSKPTGNSEAASHRSLRLKGNWLQITDQQDSRRARQPAGRIIISDPAHLDTDSLNLCPQAKDSLIKKAPWGDRGAASVWELLAITSFLSTSPHQHRAVISWQQQTCCSLCASADRTASFWSSASWLDEESGDTRKHLLWPNTL